jgi:hypothetical protein
MKGSLGWLPLCRTWRHRTDRILLHFHVTSVMMTCAPPTIAPSPVLRQNWETLTRLASRWSKLPDVDACSHTIFICSLVLRRKLINLLPLGFEVQTKKSSWWFWGPNYQTLTSRFEAKPENPRFSSPPCVWCRSHTVAPDLPIVRSPSTRLVLDYSWSSAPSLLLLPRSSSLPAMLHLPPTHHEKSKCVSPHQIS